MIKTPKLILFKTKTAVYYSVKACKVRNGRSSCHTNNSLHETQIYFINLETFPIRSLLTPTRYYHTFTPLKTKLRSNTNSKYNLLKSEIVKNAELYILRSKLFTRAYLYFSMPCTRGLKPCQTQTFKATRNGLVPTIIQKLIILSHFISRRC